MARFGACIIDAQRSGRQSQLLIVLLSAASNTSGTRSRNALKSENRSEHFFYQLKGLFETNKKRDCLGRNR
jgi:hypothetical protein